MEIAGISTRAMAQAMVPCGVRLRITASAASTMPATSTASTATATTSVQSKVMPSPMRATYHPIREAPRNASRIRGPFRRSHASATILRNSRGCSSVGRASASQAECREFDPPRPLCLPPMSHDDTGGFSLTNPAESASSGDACGDGQIGADGRTMTGNDLGGRSLVQALVQVVVQGGRDEAADSRSVEPSVVSLQCRKGPVGLNRLSSCPRTTACLKCPANPSWPP